MATQKKVDEVKALTDKMSRAKAMFLTDYRGLTHQQLESLRKVLRKVEGEYVIAKNTLLKIALDAAHKGGSQEMKDEITKLQAELKNPTAALFAYKDEIEPIKAVAAFIKTHQLPAIKIGLFGGKASTAKEFAKLATLPGRDVLLATLAMRLKGPMYGLHYALRYNMQALVTALDNVKKKKPAN